MLWSGWIYLYINGLVLKSLPTIYKWQRGQWIWWFSCGFDCLVSWHPQTCKCKVYLKHLDWEFDFKQGSPHQSHRHSPRLLFTSMDGNDSWSDDSDEWLTTPLRATRSRSGNLLFLLLSRLLVLSSIRLSLLLLASAVRLLLLFLLLVFSPLLLLNLLLLLLLITMF